MDKTRQELSIRALELLGIVGTGQEPSADNIARVERLIEPLTNRLVALNVMYRVGPDEIPLEAFEPLAVLLAREAASDFGATVMDADVQRATYDLQFLNREPATSMLLKTDIALPRGYHGRRGWAMR